MSLDYFDNGRPAVPDFHGGDTNFKSIDYLSIPLPVMQTLNALIIDGVLMRHPALRIGVIELGATWVPGWMRRSTPRTRRSARTRTACRQMDLRPSEYVQRQVRVDAVPARGHRLDDREHRARTCACSRPTSRTSKAGATRSRGSNARWTRPRSTTTRAAAFYFDNFVDLLRPVLERRGVATAFEPAS